MDQRPNVSIKNSNKPSKLMVLIALAIAIVLPFILVKLFPHKQKANYEIAQNFSSESHIEQQIASPVDSKPGSQTIPISDSAKRAAITVAQVKANDSSSLKLDLTSAKSLSAALKTVQEAPHSPTKAASEDVNVHKTLLTRRNDSLSAVFSRIGLDRQLLQTILRENPRIKSLTRLRPNEQLQYQLKNKILEKMTIPYTATQSLVVYREGQHYKSRINPYKITTSNQYITATVRGSLYTTAKRHNIPYKLIQQMTEIFAWDINFAKDVRANDQFTIIYKSTYANDKLIGTGEVVAVNYKTREKTYQAVLHKSRSGHSDYYSPTGSSLKNAFNRYPIRFSHISSTFSLGRNHPILHYKRPHHGIDLAAPIGTPILATGDGRIEIIGRQSGYGNMIKIKHNSIYSTIYGHMLKFQKGIYKGAFVKRGQVIGYVGQTGLATGPHCHYEFHIKHQPKNPTTVNLPRGDSVPAREMASFKASTNNLLALLKSYETGRFAKASKNSKTG
ncbi:MAG: peptidoglycan DD-metalloendopeptidase family protein [Tatlockia sp.]|nr:peptidoglycan DD-metalloendopeptidase family protein [Tatlockia sp.]